MLQIIFSFTNADKFEKVLSAAEIKKGGTHLLKNDLTINFFKSQVIAGATNFKDPDNQVSHVEEIKVPNCYDNRNPVGCDIVILKLYEGFKLDGCKIRQIILPSSPISLEGIAKDMVGNKFYHEQKKANKLQGK